MAGAAIVIVPIEPPYAGTPYGAPTVAAAKDVVPTIGPPMVVGAVIPAIP